MRINNKNLYIDLKYFSLGCYSLALNYEEMVNESGKNDGTDMSHDFSILPQYHSILTRISLLLKVFQCLAPSLLIIWEHVFFLAGDCHRKIKISWKARWAYMDSAMS
jgi:hypothetical protein